jgi:hypothetical protein
MANDGTDNRVRFHATAHKIATTSWALFFIWVGVAFLFEFGAGIGLLGVGLIILGGQAARRHHGLKLEGFWVLIGALFIAVSIWELVETELSLLPILLIVAGLVLLLSALRGKR